MMAHLFPFTDGAPDGRDDRARRARSTRGSTPGAVGSKVFYTNTSAEYHRGDASLIHTDPDGRRDVSPRAEHARLSLRGHGARAGRVAAYRHPGARAGRCHGHRRAVAEPARHGRTTGGSSGPAWSIWIAGSAEGIEPPPSVHPRVDDGTAVDPDELIKAFDRIPGAHYPRHHARPRRLAFDPDPEAGQPRTLPPRRWPGVRVTRVGRRRRRQRGRRASRCRSCGCRWPPTPAGTCATRTSAASEQLLVFAGSTLPFPRTRAEREATGDPRRSIEERYRSRDDYLAAVRRAARELCAQRYLLEEDIELSVTMAARLWDFWTAPDRR